MSEWRRFAGDDVDSDVDSGWYEMMVLLSTLRTI